VDHELSEVPGKVSPLEQFLRRYLDKTGGIWDEIEPQVYDVVLPEGTELPLSRGSGEGMVRLAFDPEALPEHPNAQLASFGTPLVDRLLDDAVKRGRGGHFYFIGLNLQPHDLLARLRRGLHVAPATIQIERMRALLFPQVLFWFQAAFVSDQKEQLILPVGLDLHYGREVRHLDRLLESSHLAEHPSTPLPPARTMSLQAGYRLARDQLLRTLAALGNHRGRELHERCDLQIARLKRYYADLRAELDEQKRRARNAEEAAVRHVERLAALNREEQLRVAELRQKSLLHVDLRLLQLLRIEQPKLLLRLRLLTEGHAPGHLEVVWDPLLEVVEAAACPNCGKPSYEFAHAKSGQLTCNACKSVTVERKSASARR
jgi:hypothetical protein